MKKPENIIRDQVNNVDSGSKEKITVDSARNAIDAKILRSEGKPLHKIADEMGVDKKTVQNHLERYEKIFPEMSNRSRLEWFSKNRRKIYTVIEDLAAESLANKLRNGDGTPKELISIVKTLHSIGRLEQGQSTANIAHNVSSNLDPRNEVTTLLIEDPSDDT